MFRRSLSVVTTFVILTFVYFLTGKLGLALAFVHASASPVWPPAGIALGALLLLGYQTWPAIFVGAFLVNLTTVGNVGTSMAIAGGNTLEAICGAWLVNRFAGGKRLFDWSSNVFKFALAAVISTVISPTIGVTSLELAGFAEWASYGAVWLTWWMGDVTGDLVFAPVVILWGITPRWRWDRKRAVEIGLLLLALVALAEAVFGGWFPITAKNYPIAFVCGPMVVWMAFRMSQRETATGIFILSAIAIWGTLNGFGPFVLETENQSLLVLQIATALLTITAMALASSMAERRRSEAALVAQKSLVESANQTKDKFLAMLSHELRTPLTPVVLAMETLQKRWGDDEETSSALGMIRRNIEVETRLIDDLLDVTRISKGKLELQFVSVDVHSEIVSVVEMCRGEAEAKNIRVRLVLQADDHAVAADKARFQQIIWNLLKNAIKFSHLDSEVTISSMNRSPNQLTISVQDRGIGIAPDLIEKMFDPFEQGERAFKRCAGGLGLGLAISKSLAQAHGASLVAQSNGLNRGATLSLVMKTVATAPKAREVLQTQSAVSTGSYRILLVDDHADTRAALEKLLGARGHFVRGAHDVHSALEKAKSGEFDLLISDIELPDGSGVDLMMQLSASSPLPGIAISGFGSDADTVKSLEAGFSEHLVKPVKVESLVAAIESVMMPRNSAKTPQR